jgi:hypothetical protein
MSSRNTIKRFSLTNSEERTNKTIQKEQASRYMEANSHTQPPQSIKDIKLEGRHDNKRYLYNFE